MSAEGQNSPPAAQPQAEATPAAQPQGQQSTGEARIPAPQLSTQQHAQLKLLMDKERTIREAESKLKQQEADVKWAGELRSLKDKNPLAVLEKLGLSTDELIKKASDNHPSNYAAKLEGQLSQLSQRLEEMQMREQEMRHMQAAESARNQIREYVHAAKTTDGKDKYAAIKASGMEALVFDRIQAIYNQTNQMPSYDQAASDVEKELVSFAQKLAPLLGAVQPERQATDNTPAIRNPFVTLSNDHNSQPAQKVDHQRLTNEELTRKAAALLTFDPRD